MGFREAIQYVFSPSSYKAADAEEADGAADATDNRAEQDPFVESAYRASIFPTLYAGDPIYNSAVRACVRWLGDAISLVDFQFVNRRGTPVTHLAGRYLDTLGVIGFKRHAVKGMIACGNAYWVIQPDGFEPIDYQLIRRYQDGVYYSRRGQRWPEDRILHLVYDMPRDTHSPYSWSLGSGLGVGPLVGDITSDMSLDREAADYARTILRNQGVPGVIFLPKGLGPSQNLTKEQVAAGEKQFNNAFSGANRGLAKIARNDYEVIELTGMRQKLQIADVRNMPHALVCALTGVSAMVAALPVGMENTRVGATLKEERLESWTNSAMPLSNSIADQLTQQFKLRFTGMENTMVKPSYTGVPVLRDANLESEDKLTDLLIKQLAANLIGMPEAQERLENVERD